MQCLRSEVRNLGSNSPKKRIPKPNAMKTLSRGAVKIASQVNAAISVQKAAKKFLQKRHFNQRFMRGHEDMWDKYCSVLEMHNELRQRIHQSGSFPTSSHLVHCAM